MSGKTWRNPYHGEQDSLPPAGKLDSLKAGEFNRQRWGSVWGQDTSKDPPPPSWLERGLSRLDHNSQILVINHDSASSSNSSTTGSLGSDSNKTYLRGQNLPIDADILHEREMKRQKALELQGVIKQQLEEREKKRIEEKEKKLEEERAEEERIQKETDMQRQRMEEEQQRQLDKEAMKVKKSKLMQESIESAERQAKEDKRLRRYRADKYDDSTTQKRPSYMEQCSETPEQRGVEGYGFDRVIDRDTNQKPSWRQNTSARDNLHNASPVRLPVSQEVAIVLSGRIEDPELLDKSPLKLVNLVVSPAAGLRNSCREGDWAGRNGGISLSALLGGLGGPVLLQQASATTHGSPGKGQRFGQKRLLTPSKYRVPSSSDCATQTDCEGELSDEFVERMQETRIRDTTERKETANNTDREDIDKLTNTGSVEEYSMKSLGRNKTRTRISIESRPRWNANRPGTRYRTQSEKDPHYQRRMRLRRRRVETSDEGSSDFRRSPSPHRRSYSIMKAKSRNSAKCKTKIDNYDADLSMDSLNSLIPLHVDKNGRINIEKQDEALLNGENSVSDAWGGNNILSHLNSLRNGLIMKKREWDLQACPVSPITELY